MKQILNILLGIKFDAIEIENEYSFQYEYHKGYFADVNFIGFEKVDDKWMAVVTELVDGQNDAYQIEISNIPPSIAPQILKDLQENKFTPIED